MRFAKAAVLGVVCVGMLGGCAVVMGTPMPGMLYTDLKYPSYYDGAAEKGPGSKTGTSQAICYLGLVATGDASIGAACREGGIANIHSVDTHGTSVLGIFATYTTTVTGE